MKIINRISPDRALVESNGISMEISLKLAMHAKIGDYVLVHTGFALEIMDDSEAEKTLEAISELSGVLKDLNMSGYTDI